MSAITSKTASVGVVSYAPGTRLGLTLNVDVLYDLTGKEAVLEIRKDCDSAVVWRYDSETDAQISISGQVVTILVEPDTASPDFPAAEFSSTVAGFGKCEFNIDFRTIGATTVDYRLQGDLTTTPTHGVL